MQNITIVVKTFQRPNCLNRFLESVIPLNHPIIIVDDSFKENKINVKKNLNITYIKTPFDIGLSAGRNLGLKFVQTEYVVICDDDFVFYEESNLDCFVESLSKGFDLIGGVFEEPKGIRHFEGCLELVDTSLYTKKEKKGEIQGVPVYDFVHNFFMARTEKIKKFPWDAELKVGEHIDFFFRLKNRLIVGYDERVKVKHIHDNNEKYIAFRMRAHHFIARMVQKLKLKKFVDYQGHQFVDITKTGQSKKTLENAIQLQPNIYVILNNAQDHE